MICLPGHGRGVDDIVGIDKEGKQRKRYGGYQNDFALQCIAHGIAAFAIEQIRLRPSPRRRGAQIVRRRSLPANRPGRR